MIRNRQDTLQMYDVYNTQGGLIGVASTMYDAQLILWNITFHKDELGGYLA